MNETAAPQQRVLAYDRVAQNKRRARMLMALFAVLSLPAAAFLAVYLVFFFAVVLGMLFGTLTAGGALSGDNWTIWLTVIPVLAILMTLWTPVVIYRRGVNLILRLSGARPLEAGEQPELQRSVANLCLGAGLPAPRVHLIDSSAANAFSTGMSPANSSLVVTTGLMGLLERRELEGVLAHELVQIANYDTRVSTILAAAVAFLRLPYTAVVTVVRFLFGIHWAVGGFFLLYLGLPMLISIPFAFAAGFALLNDEPEQGVIVLVTMTIPVYALFLAPLAAEVIRAGVSRQRQFLADADAVLLSRSSEPFATALAKMEAAGSGGMVVARSTAHLWTVDPIADDSWWERMWPGYHPPVQERIEILSRMGSGIPPRVLKDAAQSGRDFRSKAAGPPGSCPPAVGQIREPSSEWAGDAAAESPSAYRLTADTVVYAAPDTGSREVDTLLAGALITVHETAGEYLHVITPNDSFGYIRKLTPMTPYETRR
jgi:heat shock protein HtpX